MITTSPDSNASLNKNIDPNSQNTNEEQLDFMMLEDSFAPQNHLSLDSGISSQIHDMIFVENEVEPNNLTTPIGKDKILTDEELSEVLKESMQFEVNNVSLPAALCDDLLLQEINNIPDKMGFKIGDVADILGIKQYVLRYWESEFDLLKPKKAINNQRLYTKRDVENALLIRKLLHRDRFSIEGARNALKELKAHVRKEKNYSAVVQKFETLQDRVHSLVEDVQKLKVLFK